jgi:hypothetical protein
MAMKRQNALKFNLVSGRQESGNIVEDKGVGYALLIEGNEYYLMKLFLFDKYFFIVKNANSPKTYTVFGTKFPNEPLFKNPIGSAELIDENSSHIEVSIPLLGGPFYMSLYPA